VEELQGSDANTQSQVIIVTALYILINFVISVKFQLGRRNEGL
jgi:hypothetical protein